MTPMLTGPGYETEVGVTDQNETGVNRALERDWSIERHPFRVCSNNVSLRPFCSNPWHAHVHTAPQSCGKHSCPMSPLRRGVKLGLESLLRVLRALAPPGLSFISPILHIGHKLVHHAVWVARHNLCTGWPRTVVSVCVQPHCSLPFTTGQFGRRAGRWCSTPWDEARRMRVHQLAQTR